MKWQTPSNKRALLCWKVFEALKKIRKIGMILPCKGILPSSFWEVNTIFDRLLFTFRENFRKTSASLWFCEAIYWSQGRNEGGKGALKSPNDVTSTFFNTLYLLPQDLSFEHGTANLLLAPGAIQPRYAPDWRGPECKWKHAYANILSALFQLKLELIATI